VYAYCHPINNRLKVLKDKGGLLKRISLFNRIIIGLEDSYPRKDRGSKYLL
jgi:hypothetical protein